MKITTIPFLWLMTTDEYNNLNDDFRTIRYKSDITNNNSLNKNKN